MADLLDDIEHIKKEMRLDLAEHEVDFCIVSRREGDYDFFPLRKDPLVAWVPKDHPRVKDGFYPLLDIEMLCI